jgi:3-hydroxyacyl-[acyl-carrier-protein] dehydratase
MKDPVINRKNMVLSIEDIRSRLPHRYPFLMIDRIIKQEPGKCTAIKCVTINECHFTGHFPNQAIMPGMLIAEAMAQAACFVGSEKKADGGEIESKEESAIQKGFLINMNIKFKEPVIPGDVLNLDVIFLKSMAGMMKFSGRALVDGKIVAEGDFMVAVMS